jgi:hypothetical protein
MANEAAPIRDELRRRHARTRRRAFFFALLVPFGCVSLFLTLELLSREPNSTAGLLLFFCSIVEIGVGLGGAFLLWCALGKSRRSLAVAEQADQMSFLFTEAPEEHHYRKLRTLWLFRQANAVSARNLICGYVNGASVMGLDCTCVAAAGHESNVLIKAALAILTHGQATTAVTQTVVALPEAAEELPNFVLRPKTWVEKVSRRLGDRLTGRSDRSEFEKLYVLQAEKTEEIADRLPPQVGELCLGGNGLIVEMCRGLLAVYRKNEIADAANYPELIATALRLAEALRSRG